MLLERLVADQEVHVVRCSRIAVCADGKSSGEGMRDVGLAELLGGESNRLENFGSHDAAGEIQVGKVAGLEDGARARAVVQELRIAQYRDQPKSSLGPVYFEPFVQGRLQEESQGTEIRQWHQVAVVINQKLTPVGFLIVPLVQRLGFAGNRREDDFSKLQLGFVPYIGTPPKRLARQADLLTFHE